MTPAQAREWLKSARGGDEASFLRLVEATRDSLFRLVKRMTGREALAEEILQESYFALWRSQGAVPDDPAAWLYRSCLNRAIDYSRREATFREVEMGAAGEGQASEPGPAEMAFSRATARAIAGAMVLLPPGERLVFSLRAYEGFSFDEIASRLEIKPSTARNQYMSARRRVARALLEKGVKP